MSIGEIIGSFLSGARRSQAKPSARGTTGGAKPGGAIKNKSPYGRIPLETYTLFAEQVRNVVEPVLSYLPLETSRSLRDWTVRTTLETVFQDWRELGNPEPLGSEDVSDLGSFAELATHLAKLSGAACPEEFEAVYKAVLTALLVDWLHNWNPAGSSGPPQG